VAKYNIDKDSFLTEVKRYDLDRGPDLGYLRIEVHRVIAGVEKVGLFIAFPTQLLIGDTEDKFVAKGETAGEALTKCLDLVKGLPAEQIFSKMQQFDEDQNNSTTEE
jgi:hypothetical protein